MKYVLTMCCAVILTGSVGYANYSSEKLSTSQAIEGPVDQAQKNILDEINQQDNSPIKQSKENEILKSKNIKHEHVEKPVKSVRKQEISVAKNHNKK